MGWMLAGETNSKIYRFVVGCESNNSIASLIELAKMDLVYKLLIVLSRANSRGPFLQYNTHLDCS